jgi:hypothetical protein
MVASDASSQTSPANGTDQIRRRIASRCSASAAAKRQEGQEESPAEEAAMSAKDWRAIILSIAIIGAALIYACINRYTYIPKTGDVLDRWTGRVHHTGESLDADARLRTDK